MSQPTPDKISLTPAAQRIIDTIPGRALDRPLRCLDGASILALSLWSLIRWERRVGLRALEDTGVDLNELNHELDSFLSQKARDHARLVLMGLRDPDPCSETCQTGHPPTEELLRPLLEQAESEARILGHTYVGSEHLLLAIIRTADGKLPSEIAGRLPAYEDAKDAILVLLA